MRLKILINNFLILVFILFFPFISFSQEIYEYERMWPVLEQPWYFNKPFGIAVDSSGYIYVADTWNNRIQKFESNGQFVTRWGSYGSRDGEFYWPSGIATDRSGNIYVAERYNNRIQKFTTDGQFITKWGSLGNGDGQFNWPSGIAIDSSGNIYVADTFNNCIQKFTAKGQFITKWGSEGPGDGQFYWPYGITVDSSGYIYVADTWNNRIQKFTSNGQIIAKWGSYGSGDGEFYLPSGIAIDRNGNVYVAEEGNFRIQKFTSDGNFITKWGSFGFGNGQFYLHDGITLDDNGYVYVADTVNNRIQKFDSSGQFIIKWGSEGSEDGQFNIPYYIALDDSDNVYVADTFNHRIQKFTSNGQFITKWGSVGSEDSQFSGLSGIAINGSSNVYVTDSFNDRIQKFTSDGQFITKWGSYGSGDGQFNYPYGIAVDSSGYVYVVDKDNNRIQKFTSNGQFIIKWGSNGNGDGQFDWPTGVVIDNSGYVYVTDSFNDRIQKFTSNGQFISKWGSYGSEDGQFAIPEGIAVDNSGNIYVADQVNHRIQKFTSNGEFINKWGGLGSNAGEFSYPESIGVNSNGSVYVSDTHNNRIQIFSKVTKPFNNKAIIVTGGGPYLDSGGIRVTNNLWPTTQINANFAYHTLTTQGFNNNTIYYLSWDLNINLDLNNDGVPDVDALPTNTNLQYAITQWAKDADNVVIYLVGHGGNGTFRINETDLLKSEDLNLWLDTLQQTMLGIVVVIYDACYSGSFLPKLSPPSGEQRILISGTAEYEVAWFMNNGLVSFSYLFWSRVFYGDRVFSAFTGTQKTMGDPQRGIKNQNPQLDDNGNGKGNEGDDGVFSANYSLGKGIVPVNMNTNLFSVVLVSSDQTLNGETSATITVENIENLSAVMNVWAIVMPPDFVVTSGDPVTDLPSFDFTWNEQTQRYEGTYNGFTVMGTYTIMVYAMNNRIAVSLPKAILIQQTIGRFIDVPLGYWAEAYINALYQHGITKGCGGGRYCPLETVTMGQMAAFIIRAKFGENFSYTQTPYFCDVPPNHVFFKYVQKMKDEGLTAVSGVYGVDDGVTRGEMASFIIRAKFGDSFSYTQTPYFCDVPSNYTFFKYVQKMKDEGITTLTGVYYVDQIIPRDQMAAFIARAFLGMQ